MKCHKVVTSSFVELQAETERATEENRKPNPIVSGKLQPLYATLGMEDPQKPAAADEPKSIPWVQVHNLPDYVSFDHSAHVAAGVSCQKCHGPVESMERIRQVETLSMGWCVNCHRDATEHGIDGHAVQASTNCATCHY
jgi:hypothetical protein